MKEKKVVKCEECGKEISKQGFHLHLASRHGISVEQYVKKYGEIKTTIKVVESPKPVESISKPEEVGEKKEEVKKLEEVKVLEPIKPEITTSKAEVPITNIISLTENFKLTATFLDENKKMYEKPIIALGRIGNVTTSLIITPTGELVPPSIFENFIGVFDQRNILLPSVEPTHSEENKKKENPHRKRRHLFFFGRRKEAPINIGERIKEAGEKLERETSERTK